MDILIIKPLLLYLLVINRVAIVTFFMISVGNPKCNPNTWEAYNNECCSIDEPCGVGEGDCDLDEECHGDLVCGKNNCRRDGTGFTVFSDCCELPPETTRSGLIL